MSDKPVDRRYEVMLERYFNIIDRNLNRDTEGEGIGLIVLFVRTAEDGGTDMGTNLSQSCVVTALQGILDTIRKQNDKKR